MTNRLETAINNLYDLDSSLSPMALGNAREAAIVEGLKALAEHFGKEIQFTYIDSNGDFKFNIEGADRGHGQFGEGLAAMLSKVATRTGSVATEGCVLAQNNWTFINHFQAEKLIKIVGRELFDIDPENKPATGISM
jgi:hypothetical protein